MTRFEIDLKQRSGKWVVRIERDTLEQIQAEWKRYTAEMQGRTPDAWRRLRCTRIDDGRRTVLAQFTPQK